MKEPLVEFREVSFRYNSEPILYKFSFEIRPGETIAIVGDSGAGKSTTIRLALGALVPSSGVIVRRFKRAAIVFQDPRLLPWRTVLGNVRYSVEKWIDNPEEACRNALREVGLEGLERRYPYQLSGGEIQRVQLARAIVCEPDILFLDEFTSALNLSAKLKLEDVFRAARAKFRFSTLIVTHDLPQAERLADRIIGPIESASSSTWVPQRNYS